MDFSSGSHTERKKVVRSSVKTHNSRKFPKGCDKPKLNIVPDTRSALKKIWDVNKSAIVFTTFRKELYRNSSDTDTASECEDEFCPCPLPINLTTVYDPAFSDMSTSDLCQKGRDIYDSVILSDTQDSYKLLEQETRGQSHSPTWFAYRTGRITASRLHGVITRKPSTSPDNMVKEIMHYKGTVTTQATKWGTDMEHVATEMYKTSLLAEHENVTLTKSGLVVCEAMPYMAASPDGIRQCACHGQVLVEVKCPYKCKDKDPAELLGLPEFFLDANGKLKYGHKYYTQIQLQLYVTNLAECDLVVYTKQGIYVSQVQKDEEFCQSAISKASLFFFNEVLPELLSRKMASSLPCPPGPDSAICYCHKPITKTRVIVCKRPNCSVKQFHYKCMGITKKPADGWFCPVCRKLDQQ